VKIGNCRNNGSFLMLDNLLRATSALSGVFAGFPAASFLTRSVHCTLT
jgi:hypothetical protein